MSYLLRIPIFILLATASVFAFIGYVFFALSIVMALWIVRLAERFDLGESEQ